MITSKPKGNTVFALGMFLSICYGLLVYTLYNFFSYDTRYWYQYAIFTVITPIAAAVTIKTIQSYKIIKLGKGKISIRYPFLFKEQTLHFKTLKGWKEVIIKTQGTAFKELTLTFEKNRVRITSHENSNYQKIYTYLKTKHSSKILTN